MTKRGMARGAGVLALTVSLSAGLAGCKTPDGAALLTSGVAVMQAATLSDDDVATLARKGIKDMDAGNRVASPGSSYGVRLRKLASAYPSVDGRPLNFKVYLKNEMNAFAMPDGSVRIYSGLMDKLTDDELLFVIGHEIGHVHFGHSRQRYQLAYASSGVLALVQGAGGSVAGVPAAQAGALLSQVVQAQFSQENERESDEYGFHVAVEAKASPTAPASALRKLGDGRGRAAGVLDQLMSSHPDVESRAQRMEALARGA